MLPVRTGSPDAEDPDSALNKYNAPAPAATFTGPADPTASSSMPEAPRSPEISGSTGTQVRACQEMPLGAPAAHALRPSPVLTSPASPEGTDDDGERSAATSMLRPSSTLPEDDTRSQRGSTGGSEANDGAGYYTAQEGMPRNFRISVDGYTLLHDEDGTFAAYRINVTAGLHQWQVLRR